jgi:cytochrome c oxidase assembly protein subunit 23
MPVETDKEKVDFTSGGKLKFYPDDPKDDAHAEAFKLKEPTEFYDPCAIASEMSLKCLQRNDYDRSKCMEYFSAYRECKKAWMEKRREDRRSGRFFW